MGEGDVNEARGNETGSWLLTLRLAPNVDKTRVGQRDARDKEKQIANMTDDG
jgi:hypothetical protein